MKVNRIGKYLRPYVIAEIGVNHGGDIALAKEMIAAAARAGAHAAKFQTYKADKLAAKVSPYYWDLSEESTTTQYELFKKYDAFGEEEYRILHDFCNECSIDFMSTPFDLDSVEFLNPLMKYFKVASADITNTPLLRSIAKKKKPVIMSTGAAEIEEVRNAVSELTNFGASHVCLLHCVLNYPTAPENAKLNEIINLRDAFPHLEIGYSDHVVADETLSALEAASLLGATVLEKHFTYDKTLKGNDHYHAMDEHDLSMFCRKLEKFHAYNCSSNESKVAGEEVAVKNARRSIYALKNLEPGHVVTEQDLICKRPGTYISPIHWDSVIGSTVAEEIGEDEPLVWAKLKTK